MRNLIWLLFLSPILAFSQPASAAEQFFHQGNYAQAKSLFLAKVKSSPADMKAIEYLGDIYARENNWAKSAEYYKTLISLKPNGANYHYKYGGAYGMLAKDSNKFRALSMIGTIRESFEKAIQLDPKHIEARWALIELNLQLPAIVGGSEDKANSYANELQNLSPVDGYLAKGHIAEHFGRFQTAEAFYKQAITIGKSKTSYQKLADLYTNKMKQPAKAKSVMDRFQSAAKS